MKRPAVPVGVLAILFVPLYACTQREPVCPKGDQTEQWLYLESPQFFDADNELYRAIVARLFADDTGSATGCFGMVVTGDGAPEEAVFAACPSTEAVGSVLLVHLVASENIAAKLRTSGIQAALGVAVTRSGKSRCWTHPSPARCKRYG